MLLHGPISHWRPSCLSCNIISTLCCVHWCILAIEKWSMSLLLLHLPILTFATSYHPNQISSSWRSSLLPKYPCHSTSKIHKHSSEQIMSHMMPPIPRQITIKHEDYTAKVSSSANSNIRPAPSSCILHITAMTGVRDLGCCGPHRTIGYYISHWQWN